MFLLAVIAQALAVIGKEHDGRTIVELVRLEVVNQTSDDLVRVGNFAVVRARTAKSARGARRACAARSDGETETHGRSRRCPASARRSLPIRRHRARPGTVPASSGADRPAIVEEIEALIDAGLPTQQRRRDDGGCRVPALAQKLRQQPFTALT